MNAEHITGKQQIENLLARRSAEEWVNLDQDFRGTDISQGSSVRWPTKVDFSGDFSGANFAQAEMPPAGHCLIARPESGRGPLILSGTFIGADFRGAKLRNFQLRGDFTGANFRGADLMNCELAGKFDRADLSATFLNCDTTPTATFVGSELESAIGLECSRSQLETARLGEHPQVLASSDQIVHVGECGYRLVRLAKPEEMNPALGGPLAILDMENGNFRSRHRILEVRGLTLEIRGDPDNVVDMFELGLKAQDVTLKLPESTFNLVGHYLRVAITDSPNVTSLRLANGTFDCVDLSQSSLECLEIDLRCVRLGKITLPACLRTVVLFAKELAPWQFSATLEKMSLTDIESGLEAWDSPTMRLTIARRLLATVPRVSAQRRQNWLNSRSHFVRGVLSRKSDVHGPLAMAALLIAHENGERMSVAFSARLAERNDG